MSMNSNASNQGGFVAIFSVLIIMGILTLLTVGFTSITRQAQLRTLNDHLSSQAFYAAESGVNMAASVLAAGTSQKTECRDGATLDYDIDDDNNIAVSCLLIDGNPPNLEFSNVPVVGVGEPVLSRLASLNASTINTVQIEWDSVAQNGAIQNRTTADFLPSGTWGTGVGVMRVDLVPSNNTNRNALVDSSYTFYLYPSTSNAASTSRSVDPGYPGQGATLVTRCNPTGVYRCTAQITLNNSNASSYEVRMQAYYNEVRSSIAPLDASGNEILLQNGQAVIDSTGKANDVYRRIQVRLPITANTGMHNVFAIFSSDSICKRYVGVPNGTIAEPPCTF